MLLSVVIPVHNEEACLPGLLRALAAQDAADCELIFVDDGSTDASARILQDALESGRVAGRLVRLPGAGAGAARNAGIAAANGLYIAFADADDSLAPDYLPRLRHWAGKGADVALFTHTRCVRGEPRFHPPRPAAPSSPEALLRAFLARPTRFGVYDLLVRRSLLGPEGAAFPEGYPYYEDYAFLLRLFSLSKTLVDTGECVYCYRAVAGSAMSTFNKDRLRCLELFEGSAGLKEIYPPTLEESFRRWFAPRLYWSVLWQACQCMNAREALAFARESGARGRMRRLAGYPDKRVSLSAAVYLVCPRLYILLMKRLGRQRTLLGRGKDRNASYNRRAQL